MLISVILPVYNVSQYLSQCLDSIISQPYKELEIICINDASTDGSKEILDKYAQKDNRIKVFENSENLGAGLSRNRGLKLAKGEYVHFVDPDDWLEEDLYTKICPKISEFSNPDIIYFNYNTYDNITKEVKPTKFKNKRIINQILNPLKNTEAFDNWDRYAWIKLQRRLFLIENNIFYTSSKALEEMIPAAITYIKCQSLVYTDITGINYL